MIASSDDEADAGEPDVIVAAMSVVGAGTAGGAVQTTAGAGVTRGACVDQDGECDDGDEFEDVEDDDADDDEA